MARFITQGATPLELLSTVNHAGVDHTGFPGIPAPGLLLQAPVEIAFVGNPSTILAHGLDNTQPEIGDTGLATSLMYTPTIAGSTTFIRATIHLGNSAQSGVGAGLWLNAENFCRSWAVERIIDTGTIKSFNVFYRFPHVNTNQQTWSLRFSSNNAGQTCYVNRSGDGVRYNSTLLTVIEIREIQE